MSTVWQNTAGAREFFPAAWLSLMAVAAVRPPALVVTLCRALSGATRIQVCVCASLVHCQKNWRQPRPVTRPPRMQRKRRPRFLPALSLPAKSRCRCKSGQGTGDASREFFFCTTICIVCRSTYYYYYYYYYYCRTIISPFFATVKNGRSANYFFLSS